MGEQHSHLAVGECWALWLNGLMRQDVHMMTWFIIRLRVQFTLLLFHCFDVLVDYDRIPSDFFICFNMHLSHL
jgi:hypothetical protein